MTYLDRLREALEPVGFPVLDDNELRYVETDDLAALLAERDALAAVAEAAEVAIGTWLVPSAKKPDHPLAMARLHTAVLAARDAYDRAVSKP